MKFRAKIDGKEAIGVIRVEKDIAFLCQNIANGYSCCDKKGYSYSWSVSIGDSESLKENKVTNFFLCPDNPINAVSVGDVLLNQSERKHTIIARIGEAVITECESMAYVYSINELKNMQFKPFWIQWLSESKPEIVEYTIEDIAKLTGMPVEKIRIKDK